MTFLELCQRLQQETGTGGSKMASVSDQTGALNRIVSWINSAYKDIQNKWLDWEFLWAESTITLVAGTRDYSGPSGAGLLLEDSFYLDGEPLSYVPYEEYRRDKDGRDGQSGTPVEFTVLPNGKVRFFPTPNAAGTVNLEYHLAGAQLSANSDVPLVPALYHDAIWLRAKWYWAQFEESELEIRAADILYSEALKRLEANQLPGRSSAHGRSTGADIVVRAE